MEAISVGLLHLTLKTKKNEVSWSYLAFGDPLVIN